jgi:lipopolysaccharide exporter
MAKGAGWMTLFTLLSRVQGLISVIILARLLVPEDFGIIAMASSLIVAAEMLMELGLHVVLIQHPDPKSHHFQTAWTLNVILGLLGALIVIGLAMPAAVFYSEPRLSSVVYVLAVSIAVRGFSNIQTVRFQKNLEFRKDFILKLAPRLVGFLVTIPLAFYLRSYWALVIGTLTTIIFDVLFGYIMYPVTPRFSLASARELFHFSKWLLISNILSYGITRGVDIIVGRTASSKGLGTYTLSYEIATMPTTVLTAPINRAVFPGYSKLAGDLKLLRQGFLDVMGMITVIAFPAAIGIAAIAEIFVPVVLGDGWEQAIPILKVLAWYGAINCLLTNTGPLFNAVARPYYLTYLQIVSLVILLPSAYYLSTSKGVETIGWAFLITTCITTPITIYLVQKILNLRLSMMAAVIWRPVFASLGMYFMVTSYLHWSLSSDLISLIVAILIGAASYVLLLTGLWYLQGRPVGSEHAIFKRILTVIQPREI